MGKIIWAALALGLSAPAGAQDRATQAAVTRIFADAGPGPRFALLVEAADGSPIVAIRPDERFIPASNAKLLTTAAAFADGAALSAQAGTAVRMEGRDVVLAGAGDGWLSSAADCATSCLATLADAVAARTRRVADVIGDDSLFPDERWPAGMSWNNIASRSGAAVSALSLDDNVVTVRVTPAGIGRPPMAAPGYLTIDNRAATVPGDRVALRLEREPNGAVTRLMGSIGVDAAPQHIATSVDDPAHYAAWRLAELLRARGVRVTGSIRVRHRPLSPVDDPETRGAAPPVHASDRPVLARLPLPPLDEAAVRVNKPSQNLHADLLLRRLGLVAGSGSVADGLRRVTATMAAAGAGPTGYALSDGSGMSTYDRLSPRAAVALVRWSEGQPWGGAWRASLPVGGVDGTLARRFAGTPLAGKVFAKTGSLNATNALSGWLVAASGRTLRFSTFANDVPAGVSGTQVIDRALQAVAAAN